MICRLIFAAALSLATPALAQTAAPTSPPSASTAEEISEARAYADSLIARGEASAYFTNITTTGVASVRHNASGMICQFEQSQLDTIMIFPQSESEIPLGEDVGCSMGLDAFSAEVTTYATRYNPLPSEASILAQSVNAITARFENAEPYSGDIATLSTDGKPAPKTAAFRVAAPQGELFTMVLVSHRTTWGYKVRASGPVDQASVVSLMAGLSMLRINGDAPDDASPH